MLAVGQSNGSQKECGAGNAQPRRKSEFLTVLSTSTMALPVPSTRKKTYTIPFKVSNYTTNLFSVSFHRFFGIVPIDLFGVVSIEQRGLLAERRRLESTEQLLTSFFAVTHLRA
jgi:hypothetical protein